MLRNDTKNAPSYGFLPRKGAFGMYYIDVSGVMITIL